MTFTLHRLQLSGSFHYYVQDEEEEEGRCGHGYFMVEPRLGYGDDDPLQLDSIQCQSVLTKNLGTFDSWEDRLRVAPESGYNMVHFTPLQVFYFLKIYM